MSTQNLLQSTAAEIKAVERVLHEALDDSGVREPDGYFVALSVACVEAAKDARLREFVAECQPDIQAGRLQAVPDPLDAALGEGRR